MDKTHMQTHSRYRTARRILLFWTLLIGGGAVAGAAGMLLDPSGRALGMDAMLPYFQVLPFADVLFRDLTFSGWALLIVNGLTNLTAAGLLLAEKRAGVTLGGLFGVTLMLWICIQFYMFPPNGNRVQKVDPSCRGSGDSDRGPACQILADKQQNDHP